MKDKTEYPRAGAGRRLGFRAGAVAALTMCLALLVGLSAASAQTGAAKTAKKLTLTEVDYFTSPPALTAMPPILKACAREADVNIQRQVVPLANLVPKLLQDVSAHSFPDIALIDNPNLQQFAATGALAPISTISTKGLFPSVVAAGSYKGKSYGFAPGVNDLALYYNKQLLAAAHIKPPTTWAQLQSDAKALTSGTTYGLAFSAPNEEEASFQFEPFFWTDGASLLKLNSSKAVNALTYWQTLVNAGSVSKSVVTWTQADVEEQFAAGHAAMMVNGPWQLPVLKGTTKFTYGIVQIPVPKAGESPISPLGGEMWTVGNHGGGAAQKKSAEVVQCLLSRKESLAWSKTAGYLSTNEAAAKSQAKANPLLEAFVKEIPTARARTTQLGVKYNQVSQALWTAIQSVLAGSASPTSALNTAQQQATASS